MDVKVAGDAADNRNEAQSLLAKHDAQAVVVLVILKNGQATATMATSSPSTYAAVDGWLRSFIGNLPKNPFQTVFGWSKRGVPTPE